MKVGRPLFAGVMVAALLGLLAATASATRLASSSQTIRAGFARLNFTGPWGTTECPLTLEGSFHSRTITKTLGSLAGLITRAILGACLRGSGTILTATLPWHARYQGFAGTLPNINSISADVAGVAWQIREPVFGITCLASGGFPRMTLTREAGGALTTIVASGNSPTNC